MNLTGEKLKREPLIHISKRGALPFWKSWLIRLGAIAASLLVCAIITYTLTKINPLSVFAALVQGAVGTTRKIWTLLQGVAMLLCVALAVTPAFKMRFWNIGAEGQVLMGGFAAAACMILFGDKLQPTVLLLVVILSSIVAGAIWAVIPAIFKAFWNTNETLFTLMMNYIVMQIIAFFSHVWANPKGSGQINTINERTEAGWLPVIGNYPYLLNILIVAVLTVAVYIYLTHSKHGYEIAVVGESENTAKYIGIHVRKVIIRTMLLSGALCGVAGLLLVAGTDHTIKSDTAGGRGFTAIMVSWLAKFNPLVMILTSLLLIFMQQGAGEISSGLGLNKSFSDILSGVIIFFIIGSEFFIQYQIKFRKHKEVEAK